MPPLAPTELATLLTQIASRDGVNPTVLPEVRTMRAPSRPRAPVVYEPSIVIVAQGCKRGFLGDRSFTYDASHYLVLSVPQPFECEVCAAPHGPMLGLSVKVDPALVAELMAARGESNQPREDQPPTLEATPLDASLADTALRLARALAHVEEARVLGPALVREIVYRVLCGAQGHILRALVLQKGHFVSLAKVLRHIHAHLEAPLRVETLARQASLSLSAFHAHFRAVTHHTPVQYIKALRLHRARQLMLHERSTASAAAHRVGYESVSQFSREYRRHFGLSPAQDTRAAPLSRVA